MTQPNLNSHSSKTRPAWEVPTKATSFGAGPAAHQTPLLSVRLQLHQAALGPDTRVSPYLTTPQAAQSILLSASMCVTQVH